jgi:hypothetical protein
MTMALLIPGSSACGGLNLRFPRSLTRQSRRLSHCTGVRGEEHVRSENPWAGCSREAAQWQLAVSTQAHLTPHVQANHWHHWSSDTTSHKCTWGDERTQFALGGLLRLSLFSLSPGIPMSKQSRDI